MEERLSCSLKERSFSIPCWLAWVGILMASAHQDELARRVVAAGCSLMHEMGSDCAASAPPGTTVVLYATAPTMALVGLARIAAVKVGSPRDVWRAHRSQTGISRREFDEYMSGATQASGLTLEEPQPFEEPVPLSALRAAGTFHPPQSYRYLKGEALRQVAEASPSAGTVLRGVLGDPVPA
ncbi:hypothetical protein ACWIG5_00155 [Streptomyces lydicus]